MTIEAAINKPMTRHRGLKRHHLYGYLLHFQLNQQTHDPTQGIKTIPFSFLNPFLFYQQTHDPTQGIKTNFINTVKTI